LPDQGIHESKKLEAKSPSQGTLAGQCGINSSLEVFMGDATGLPKYKDKRAATFFRELFGLLFEAFATSC
jgi:hypothetical protein